MYFFRFSSFIPNINNDFMILAMTNSEENSGEDSEFRDQETDKYLPIVGSSSRSVKENKKISKLRLKNLTKEIQKLSDDNFKTMIQKEREEELSKDPNLSQEDRDRHKEISENLLSIGLKMKQEHNNKKKLAESLERQLYRNVSDLDQSSDINQSSSTNDYSSFMDDFDI
jgi:hypothetical protein